MHRHFEWKTKRKWKMRMHKRLTFKMTWELVNTLYYRWQPFDTALSRTCDCFGTVLQMVLVVGSLKQMINSKSHRWRFISVAAQTDDRIYTIHKTLAAAHNVFIRSIVRSGFRNVVCRLFIVGIISAACGRGSTRHRHANLFRCAVSVHWRVQLLNENYEWKQKKRTVIKSVTNRKTIRWRIDKWSTVVSA